jgi:hypothetical protein
MQPSFTLPSKFAGKQYNWPCRIVGKHPSNDTVLVERFALYGTQWVAQSDLLHPSRILAPEEPSPYFTKAQEMVAAAHTLMAVASGGQKISKPPLPLSPTGPALVSAPKNAHKALRTTQKPLQRTSKERARSKKPQRCRSEIERVSDFPKVPDGFRRVGIERDLYQCTRPPCGMRVYSSEVDDHVCKDKLEVEKSPSARKPRKIQKSPVLPSRPAVQTSPFLFSDTPSVGPVKPPLRLNEILVDSDLSEEERAEMMDECVSDAEELLQRVLPLVGKRVKVDWEWTDKTVRKERGLLLGAKIEDGDTVVTCVRYDGEESAVTTTLLSLSDFWDHWELE